MVGQSIVALYDYTPKYLDEKTLARGESLVLLGEGDSLVWCVVR